MVVVEPIRDDSLRAVALTDPGQRSQDTSVHWYGCIVDLVGLCNKHALAVAQWQVYGRLEGFGGSRMVGLREQVSECTERTDAVVRVGEQGADEG